MQLTFICLAGLCTKTGALLLADCSFFVEKPVQLNYLLANQGLAFGGHAGTVS